MLKRRTEILDSGHGVLRNVSVSLIPLVIVANYFIFKYGSNHMYGIKDTMVSQYSSLDPSFLLGTD